MLELRQVEKRFGDLRVLAGVDLTVRGGEAVAVVGGNGSGKTTTLRCAVGLARPDRGAIWIDGIDLQAAPRRALERVSFLPQKPSFPATLTVREIVGVAAQLRGLSARAADREIERCELQAVAGRTIQALSGGERQRVGLAVTFVADVPVFVFDEPSVSLDPRAARLLVTRARELRREGRAVLYSTHVAADIDALATRVALLRSGHLTMLDDLQLRGELPAGCRPFTAGERALQRLEDTTGEEHVERMEGAGGARAGGDGVVLEWSARAPAAHARRA